MSTTIENALKLFRQHGGMLRTREALSKGVHPETLYAMRDRGLLVEEIRGLYRLADAPTPDNPNLAYVAAKAPHSVVCLVSALSFHGLTTQIPRAIQLAVPRGAYHRITLFPAPVEVFRFDPKTFDHGIETHLVNDMPVRVYSIARTLADVFKYRNKLGMDVALEALQLAKERTKVAPTEILQAAREVRQESVMTPYLQSTFSR